MRFRAGHRSALSFGKWHCRLSVAALATLAITPTTAAPALIPGYFLGQAVSAEAQAKLGSISLDLSNAAVASCPCRGTNGHRQITTVTALSVGAGGSVLSTGVNQSTSYGLKTESTADTKQTANIAKISLLGGLITADALHAVAEVSATPTSLSPISQGSGFVNLVVAGHKVTGYIKPNTTLNLPGVGSVTLKFVNAVTYGSDAAGVEVEMLRITALQSNAVGLPVGVTLIVGEAFAGFARSQPKATVGGFAETIGVTTNAGTLLNEAASAGTASAVPPCVGTSGATLMASVGKIGAAGLLAVNAGDTSAFSGPVGKAMVARTTSSVGKVSLLGGIITADTIIASAQESRTGTESTPSAAGSTFGNVSVLGIPIASNVAANTLISLPDLGYVILNEQSATISDHFQVNGLHIVVTAGNTLNLPVGAEIFVAHADATVSAF